MPRRWEGHRCEAIGVAVGAQRSPRRILHFAGKLLHFVWLRNSGSSASEPTFPVHERVLERTHWCNPGRTTAETIAVIKGCSSHSDAGGCVGTHEHDASRFGRVILGTGQPEQPRFVAPRSPLACYSFVPASLEASARQTYRYLSSLEVTTGVFLSRVTRFKAERRFCIFSPSRLLSGILTASSALSFERSPRISDTAFRCFPLRPSGTSDRFTAE